MDVGHGKVMLTRAKSEDHWPCQFCLQSYEQMCLLLQVVLFKFHKLTEALQFLVGALAVLPDGINFFFKQSDCWLTIFVSAIYPEKNVQFWSTWELLVTVCFKFKGWCLAGFFYASKKLQTSCLNVHPINFTRDLCTKRLLKWLSTPRWINVIWN